MPKPQDVTKIYLESLNLFNKKLLDYGTGDIEEVGITGVVSRLTDKFARLKNLIGKAEPECESLEDTWLDIMGYAVIGLLLQRKQWSKESYADARASVGLVDNSRKLQIKRDECSKQFGPITPRLVGDVGYDLYTTEQTVIPAGAPRPTQIPTGTSIKVPKGYWALIINRSSTAMKLGVDVVNGVIDEGYTGPLFACCWNRTKEDIVIEKGTRLAQFLLFPATVPESIEVNELPTTERGSAGFGSTGK